MSIKNLKQIAGKKLSSDFYLQECTKAARNLIGKVLVRRFEGVIYAGIIVETEAYKGSIDAASHSFRGMTKRNEVMFGEGGRCYVYFTYGNHYCMNAVTNIPGIAHAVLIRALEPVLGIENMKKNRRTENLYNLTSGPGKLTQAMKIDLRMNGKSLRSPDLYIADNVSGRIFKIAKSKRIGITKNPDKLWRYCTAESPFVSRTNVKNAPAKLRK